MLLAVSSSSRNSEWHPWMQMQHAPNACQGWLLSSSRQESPLFSSLISFSASPVPNSQPLVACWSSSLILSRDDYQSANPPWGLTPRQAKRTGPQCSLFPLWNPSAYPLDHNSVAFLSLQRLQFLPLSPGLECTRHRWKKAGELENQGT